MYRDYECCSQRSHQPHRSDKAPLPTPSDFLGGEAVSIVSEYLMEALKAVANVALSDLPTPTFEVHEVFSSPFLWWYHRRDEIAEAQHELDNKLQENLLTLKGYILERLGSEWSEVDSLLKDGMISAQYIHYLFVSLNSLAFLLERWEAFRELTNSGA